MKKLAAVLLVLVGGVALAQFVPPTSGSTGGAVQSSGITTSFVDAGVVAANAVDLRRGGAVSISEGTSNRLLLKAPGGVYTAGGSGVGDINMNGDFYLGSAAQFSIGVATRKITSDGTVQTPGIITSFVDAGVIIVNGSEEIPVNIYPNWHDHSGGGYWSLGISTSAVGNIDAIGFFRTAGTTPYFHIDPSTGYAVSRFGLTISGANDGTLQRQVPTAAPNDGGSPQPYIEYGRDVMSSGTKTVTFKNAFTIAPACVCTDGSTLGDCDAPISTISTTQAIFNGTTTDRFSYICIGDR